MNSAIETWFQEIGLAAVSVAQAPTARVLVYSEAEDGVVSADVFYSSASGVVICKVGVASLKALVYGFWQEWKTVPANRAWRAMSFVIDGDKFSIDLAYPDALGAAEGLTERRPAAVRKYFGDAKVYYFRPR